MRIRRPIFFFVALTIAACAPWRDDFEVYAFYPGPENFAEEVPPLTPGAPLTVGHAPADASSTQRAALWWVNTYRIHAGLDPMDQDPTLNAAAVDHAAYLLANPGLYVGSTRTPHEQVEGTPGFFGVTHWERMLARGYDGAPLSEVIAFEAVPAVAVTRWMETVYHRLPLLHASARHLGYGGASLGRGRVDVLDVGEGDGPTWHVPNGTIWPPDGAQDVERQWDGRESPQPPAPAGGYPSGPVITLSFGAGEPPTVAVAELRHVETGELLPLVVVTPETDSLLRGFGAVAAYAEDPLPGGQTFEVYLRGDAAGAPFERTSRFTTRANDGCDLVAQDCGVGRACYEGAPGIGVCAWEGPQHAGDDCDFHNDCRAGAKCVGGTCSDYCSLEGCPAFCDGAFHVVDQAGGVGVCGT